MPTNALYVKIIRIFTYNPYNSLLSGKLCAHRRVPQVEFDKSEMGVNAEATEVVRFVPFINKGGDGSRKALCLR
jgi:hypothetical protein